MVSRNDHEQERRKGAEILEEKNRQACIVFAEALRLNDESLRIQRELGRKPESVIDQRYYEAVYWMLSLGTHDDRAVLLLGSKDEINKLVAKVLRANGFTDESGHWKEI